MRLHEVDAQHAVDCTRPATPMFSAYPAAGESVPTDCHAIAGVPTSAGAAAAVSGASAMSAAIAE
ncbi:hypothetical protein [uncultured Selenomonas sp.]|uniref:hypothetical protein n=1 Tax=uncultured Selenomonas sp. TaxID=159275 RepID=UPI0025F66B1D|nr:hypothetical protein [uncultured Selenomonas sp.]